MINALVLVLQVAIFIVVALKLNDLRYRAWKRYYPDGTKLEWKFREILDMDDPQRFSVSRVFIHSLYIFILLAFAVFTFVDKDHTAVLYLTAFKASVLYFFRFLFDCLIFKRWKRIYEHGTVTQWRKREENGMTSSGKLTLNSIMFWGAWGFLYVVLFGSMFFEKIEAKFSSLVKTSLELFNMSYI